MFNYINYEKLLKLALDSGYYFSNYEKSDIKNIILLRHDIDISPKLALEIAKIENNLGIKATYFFMIRSPFYNLFSRANNNIVKEIISLGHEIGLHYDEGYYSKNMDLQFLIDNEIKVLENNFDIKVNVVSFHQPSKKVIENKIKIKQINTYDKEFFKDIKYISDSNMDFKENPLKVIESREVSKIQLLIHPIWWMIDGNNTEEKFINTIKLNFDLEQIQILETERAYGVKKKLILKKSNDVTKDIN
ncbi:hypothetical protein [Halarcobacter sp.]|uniref:hypothetical protein n=1 Tax=Halarcobacter sp. TaxID=2321133 RepID=UPI003B008CC2